MNDNPLEVNSRRIDANRSCSNALVRENRIGRFSISRRLLLTSKRLCALFGTMIVVRADSDFYRDSVDYIAYSAIFPAIEHGAEPPKYHIWINVDVDAELGFSIEDRTDSWNDCGVSITEKENEVTDG